MKNERRYGFNDLQFVRRGGILHSNKILNGRYVIHVSSAYSLSINEGGDLILMVEPDEFDIYMSEIIYGREYVMYTDRIGFYNATALDKREVSLVIDLMFNIDTHADAFHYGFEETPPWFNNAKNEGLIEERIIDNMLSYCIVKNRPPDFYLNKGDYVMIDEDNIIYGCPEEIFVKIFVKD